MNSKDKFVIGLGNPGKEYINNRHNIGFLLIENLSEKYKVNFTFKNKLKSSYSEFKKNDITYRLFMPNTFMNKSGDSVKAIVEYYKIDLNQIYIILDDINLPLGQIRFRKKGSSGGHNGLKNIIEKLNTQDFNRIRIGIGSPPILKESRDSNTISHVLGNFSSEEKLILNKVYKHLIESIEQLSIKNEDYIMSDLNSFHKENTNK